MRECSTGHRRKTIEVDAELIRLLRDPKATRLRAALRDRGQVVNERAARRRKAIARHAAAGWSPGASARELGLTSAYVGKVRRRIEKEEGQS